MERETHQKTDIRDQIFRQVENYVVTAAISFTQAGRVCGLKRAMELAEALGLEVLSNVEDGMQIHAGESILLLRGTPRQIVMAEEQLDRSPLKELGDCYSCFPGCGSCAGKGGNHLRLHEKNSS